MSKGEEIRLEQEKAAQEVAHDLIEEDLHNLIEKNCPDLLANFGTIEGNEDSITKSLDDLEINKSTKKSKGKKQRPSENKNPALTQVSKKSKDKSLPPSSGASQQSGPFHQPNLTPQSFPTVGPGMPPTVFPRIPPVPFDTSSFQSPFGQFPPLSSHPSMAPPFSLPNMDQIDRVAAGDPALKVNRQIRKDRC